MRIIIAIPHFSLGNREHQAWRDFVIRKVLWSWKGSLWVKNTPGPGLSWSAAPYSHLYTSGQYSLSSPTWEKLGAPAHFFSLIPHCDLSQATLQPYWTSGNFASLPGGFCMLSLYLCSFFFLDTIPNFSTWCVPTHLSRLSLDVPTSRMPLLTWFRASYFSSWLAHQSPAWVLGLQLLFSTQSSQGTANGFSKTNLVMSLFA